MSNVFIFGATGIIGNAVAKAFVARGYQVYGLVRTEEKAKELRKHEIHSVIGKAQEPQTWESFALKADIIVEAFMDYQDYSAGAIVKKTLLDIAQKHKEKVIIYTSGVWVYGFTQHLVDENSPLDPVDLVKGRGAIETAYLEAGAVVLRPAAVYGLSGSLTGSIFKSLKDGKGEFPGKKNVDPSWALVHAVDLADAYVRAAEKGSSIRGQVFNVVSHSERIADVAHAAAKVLGYKGDIKFVEPQDPFSVALSLSQRHISSNKAKLVLGWAPKHNSLVADIERYVAAWEASL